MIPSLVFRHPETVTEYNMAALLAIHIALWLLAAIHIALWLPTDTHIALWLPVATCIAHSNNVVMGYKCL